MFPSPFTASPSQAKQTKATFAKPEDYLSYELGKAVQELPPLYTRVLALGLSGIVFVALGWAHFSQVDEVATAPGELIASVQVRPVRSLGGGTIREVRVKEGDRVQKGDILVERDPDLQQAEVNRLAKSSQLINEDIRRLEAERTGQSQAGTVLQDQLLTSRLQDFAARQAAATAEVNRQVSLFNEAKLKHARLQENIVTAKPTLVDSQTSFRNAQALYRQAQTLLANAQQREQGLRKLLTAGAAPRLDYLDAQSRVIQAQAEVKRAEDGITLAQTKVTEALDKVASLEKDAAGQFQQVRQAYQAFQSARNQSQRVAAERKSEVLTQLTKRREEQATIDGQLNQAQKQREQETLQAPLSGTVYNVKATKGPVQAGEELLSILPEGEDLLLEVKVLNRDIGFIRPGMKTKVKMATFPFQEFGTINGMVVQVSPNAVTDKKLGLVFPTRIKLEKSAMRVRGQTIVFTPGMAATGEIVTRRKSVLTFLIEPVTRRFDEAFSVR